MNPTSLLETKTRTGHEGLVCVTHAKVTGQSTFRRPARGGVTYGARLMAETSSGGAGGANCRGSHEAVMPAP